MTDDNAPFWLQFWNAEQAAKCAECPFLASHKKTARLFVARETEYRDALEKIARLVDPERGLNGKTHDALPGMVAEWGTYRGDKREMAKEIRVLTAENDRLKAEIWNATHKGAV